MPQAPFSRIATTEDSPKSTASFNFVDPPCMSDEEPHATTESEQGIDEGALPHNETKVLCAHVPPGPPPLHDTMR